MVSHQADNPESIFSTGDDALEVHSLPSPTGTRQPQRSPYTSSSSPAPLSPMMSSTHFLQNLHVHISPSSLEPDNYAISMERHQNHAISTSDLGQQSRVLRLPLPLPGDEPHMNGGLKDLDC